MSIDPRIAAFADSHLLLLDPELEPFDVVSLLRNIRPSLPAGELLQGENGARSYRMSRYSQLVGPFPVDPQMAEALSLPRDASSLFALECPRDREPVPPPSWLPDIDGLVSAFPAGLPCREEGRVLDEVIAVARRLRLAVRLAEESSLGARVLRPDTETHPNLFVYSENWLQPQVLLTQVASVAPQVRWPRPPSPLEAARGRELGAGDGPVELDGYAIEVPLTDQLGPRAGFIEIQVGLEEHIPTALRDHVSGSQVAYTLRWVDTDNRGRFADIDDELRAIRTEAIGTLERCAAAIITAVGGAGVDESGFLVSAQQLRE
ncbi:hypothetical protein [Brevibacterium jeotgali]|uniref:Uncharacterized protein n=1 Tax=Brevibacterium jeotgali TaxID=1262550 RepID=A0A2H1L5B0_9MICO|nr:hypothetical protein [Brevibacterium jeotgali]TWB98455.1 hypothetical protein FB108_2343 [Brevibacterium jeotgali]SMY12094.1 hypothetical protein BJEO58_01688 [Brevibacterium jeotgali]